MPDDEEIKMCRHLKDQNVIAVAGFPSTFEKFNRWHRLLCCYQCHVRCAHREWEERAYQAGYHQALEDIGCNAKPQHQPASGAEVRDSLEVNRG